MADKMMKIAVRGNDGLAKPVRSDNKGNVGVELAASHLADPISLANKDGGMTRPILLTPRDGLYHSFPGMCYTDSGRIITVWRTGAIHGVEYGSAIRGKYSDDLGRTWTDMGDIFQNPLEDMRDAMLYQQQSTGRLFMHWKSSTSTTYSDPRLAYSDDDGETWTEVDIKSQLVSTDIPWVFPSRGMTEDVTGALYMPFYTTKPEHTKNSVFVTKSVDNGLTWQTPVLVFEGSGAISFNECSIVFMPRADFRNHFSYNVDAGALIAITRSTAGYSRMAVSVDKGVTWNQVTDNIGYQLHGSSLLKTMNDNLILAGRVNNSPMIFVSQDYGLSSGKPLFVLSNGRGGYQQIAEIAPNLYATIYDIDEGQVREDVGDQYSDVFLRFFSLPTALPKPKPKWVNLTKSDAVAASNGNEISTFFSPYPVKIKQIDINIPAIAASDGSGTHQLILRIDGIEVMDLLSVYSSGLSVKNFSVNASSTKNPTAELSQLAVLQNLTFGAGSTFEIRYRNYASLPQSGLRVMRVLVEQV